MPTPRGLSQAPTSFIGSWYQDIHRLPLVACHNKKLRNHKTLQRDARVHYTVLKIRAGTPALPPPPIEQTPQTPGKQHTRTRHPHQRFDESRPQPPTTLTHISVTVTLEETDPTPREKPSVSRARFLRTQQRASAHPPPLAHVPHIHPRRDFRSTSSLEQVPGLMVNVPHSEAPSP